MIEIVVDKDVKDLKCDCCGKIDWRNGRKEEIQVDGKIVHKFYCKDYVESLALFKNK